MTRPHVFTSITPSLRLLSLLATLSITLALSACDSYSSKPVAASSAPVATTDGAASTVACPSKDLKAFVAAFAEDPALQKAFTAATVDTAFVDMSAQPEPTESVKALPREKLNYPVMPNRAQQQKEGLQYREVANESGRAVVVLEIPDTDAQLLYTFRRDACWTLVKIVDPAYGKALPGKEAARDSLCADGEHVVFSCALKDSKKMASMCASRDISEATGYFYYAYGVKGSPELVFPKTRAPSMTDFMRTHLMFAGNTGGYAYSFDTAGSTYAVYSISGSEGLENQGVAVFKGNFGKAQQILACDPSTVFDSDDESLIGLTLKWKTDSRIESSGIPIVSP